MGRLTIKIIEASKLTNYDSNKKSIDLLALLTKLLLSSQTLPQYLEIAHIKFIIAPFTVNFNLINIYCSAKDALLLFVNAGHNALAMVDMPALQLQGWTWLQTDAARFIQFLVMHFFTSPLANLCHRLIIIWVSRITTWFGFFVGVCSANAPAGQDVSQALACSTTALANWSTPCRYLIPALADAANDHCDQN